MANLYEISKDYSKLISEDLDLELIEDTIEAIEGEFEDKAESIVKSIKQKEMLSKALKDEAKKMNERAKHIENSIESIKQYLIRSMENMEKSSISCGLHKITVRKPIHTVSIIDVEKLPARFVDYKTVTIADKIAIKREILAGVSVSGAEIANGKKSLLIK